jgi:hypothetical protein
VERKLRFVAHLKTLYESFEKTPVWPFDMAMLVKCMSLVAMPAVPAVFGYLRLLVERGIFQ